MPSSSHELPEKPELTNDDPELLSNILVSPDFRDRAVAQLISYSNRTNFEGGFAFYTNGSCQIDLPENPNFDEYGALDAFEAMNKGYASFNNSNLTYEQDPGDPDPDATKSRIRRDIALYVHSHPSSHKDSGVGVLTITDALFPSLPDLDNWENLNMYSRNYTSGILTPEGNPRLLLWRNSNTRPFMPYYHRYTEQPSSNVLIRAMQESGINTAVIDLGLSGQEYQIAVEQVVQILFG